MAANLDNRMSPMSLKTTTRLMIDSMMLPLKEIERKLV